MGSPCELRLYANDKKTASQIANDAIAEVNRLEIKYSRYRNDSVTTKINNSAGNKNGIKIDTETALLLNYAQVGYEQSAGLFDITSGILRKAWDFRSNKIPEQQEIEALLPLIGWNKLIWNPSILCLPLQGMELDFGGYVKESAADVAANFCILAGIQGGLVNLGGDICIIGGLASSGDYERFMMVDGIRYAHILNPHTGMPVNTLASTSVCAEQCVVAGTSSTIAMLKGEQQGAAWLEELGLPYLCMNQNEEVFGTLKHVSSSEE